MERDHPERTKEALGRFQRAAVVVNLARLCLMRQSRSMFWIPRGSSRLSGESEFWCSKT